VQFAGTVMNFLPAPLVAMEGYSTKFITFDGTTLSTKYANMVPIDD
jgi:hypothetical protein